MYIQQYESSMISLVSKVNSYSGTQGNHVSGIAVDNPHRGLKDSMCLHTIHNRFQNDKLVDFRSRF